MSFLEQSLPEAHRRVIFYSPTCPACRASQDEFDVLVEDHGFEAIDTRTGNVPAWVKFVPTIALVYDSEQYEVYQGERNVPLVMAWVNSSESRSL